MNNIKVKVLNPEAVAEAEKMMVCAARLTQRGEKIKDIDDFMQLYNKGYTTETVKNMAQLPHNTIRQFNMINVVVIGASRRFLAQITRRRVGVTFTSASLQYSDYSDDADFVVPYEIMEQGQEYVSAYLKHCAEMMAVYKHIIADGVENDTAGYVAPQSLANVLIIGATPQAWIEMISQRACMRNTKETQYVMLRIWEQLFALNPIMFSTEVAGPDCIRTHCKEGHFECNKDFILGCEESTPSEFINVLFPLLTEQSEL